jgi:hypothetical protein
MILEKVLNENSVRYYSDLDLKIERISTGEIHTTVINKPGMINEYREIKESINEDPSYAREAALYKTLLDTVTGEEGVEE